jgi:hypothetical protein
MFAESRIAMSFAVILSAAALPLSTHGFAKNSRFDWDGYATGSQNVKSTRAHTNHYHRGSAIRGEQAPQRRTQPSWIDDPVSPGG